MSSLKMNICIILFCIFVCIFFSINYIFLCLPFLFIIIFTLMCCRYDTAVIQIKK